MISTTDKRWPIGIEEWTKQHEQRQQANEILPHNLIKFTFK